MLWYADQKNDEAAGIAVLFSYRHNKLFAVYMQLCVVQTILFSLLLIRPAYFYTAIKGYGNSPCGKSSCSRTEIIADKNTQNYETIYNPAGWFPTGDFHSYDTMGTTDYVFCDFDQCLWAEDNLLETQFYSQRSPCTTSALKSTTVPKLMTSKQSDYPNPSRGILGGYNPCETNPQEISCPGNVDTSDNDGKRFKEGSARKVCSVCGHYKNSYKAILGIPDEFGRSDIWADANTECAPKPDGAVNVFCFVCPSHNEKTTESALTWIITLNVITILEPLLAIVLIIKYSFIAFNKTIVPSEEIYRDDSDPVIEPQLLVSTIKKSARTSRTSRKRKSVVQLI